MKKIGFIILCIISSLCITSCTNRNKVKEYVLTYTPVDAEEIVAGYKGRDDCTDIYLNDEGDVVMLLTEKQRKNLLKIRYESLDNPDNINFPIGHIGPTYTFQNNYTEFKVEGTKEEIVNFDETIAWFVFEAEMLQILEGTQDWHLSMTLIDTEQNDVLHTFSLPEEEIDWSILQDE